MHSVDPPSPVRMQPMAVGGPLGQEQKQQVGVAPTAPAAAEGTQTVGNGHASMQVQEDGAAVGEDPVQANASQTEGHGDGAPSADEAVDADLESAWETPAIRLFLALACDLRNSEFVSVGTHWDCFARAPPPHLEQRHSTRVGPTSTTRRRGRKPLISSSECTRSFLTSAFPHQVLLLLRPNLTHCLVLTPPRLPRGLIG